MRASVPPYLSFSYHFPYIHYTSFFLASYRGFSFLKPYSQNVVLGFT